MVTLYIKFTEIIKFFAGPAGQNLINFIAGPAVPFRAGFLRKNSCRAVQDFVSAGH